jgi:hypothetical protein
MKKTKREFAPMKSSNPTNSVISSNAAFYLGNVRRVRATRPRFKPKFAGLVDGIYTDLLPPGMSQKGAQLAHARRALDGYLQLEPKRSHYSKHSGKFWVSLARKGLIQALPPKARRLRDL